MRLDALDAPPITAASSETKLHPEQRADLLLALHQLRSDPDAARANLCAAHIIGELLRASDGAEITQH